MTSREWLGGLEVGDRVVIHSRYEPVVDRVERLTKTLIVLKGGSRFRKETGSEHGGGDLYFGRKFLREYTAEEGSKILEAQTIRRIAGRLSRVKWEEFSLESLFKIDTAVKAARDAQVELPRGKEDE